MEEFFYLIEIIEYLVEDGYSVNFSELEKILSDVKPNNSKILLPKDFKIDKIYTCKESVSDTYYTFVFAISSHRYKFKGILINAIEQQSESTIYNNILNSINILFQKIKKMKINTLSR